MCGSKAFNPCRQVKIPCFFNKNKIEFILYSPYIRSAGSNIKSSASDSYIAGNFRISNIGKLEISCPEEF